MTPNSGLDPYHDVINRAFVIAAEHSEGCGPAHVLAALSELDGSIGAALTPTIGGEMMPRPADAPVAAGGWATYVTMQIQDAAIEFADRRSEDPQPAHLLVAVLDQGNDEAMDMLARAGIDPDNLRRVALDLLGANPDHAQIELPDVVPAGMMNRPILDESELDLSAWKILMWRQAHLPVVRLRNIGDWECLRRLEVDAAYRLCQRLHLDESQQLSLSEHHYRRVQQFAHKARPDLISPQDREEIYDGPFLSFGYAARGENNLPYQQQRFLRITSGLKTWFKAPRGQLARLREGTQLQLFAFRIRDAYRGIPEIESPE